MENCLPTSLRTCLLVCCLPFPGLVSAHGGSHADETQPVDLVATDASLQTLTEIELVQAANPSEVVRPAPETTMNPSVGGKWGAVYDWPLVAVHAALLPNGKVLAWDATPDDSDDDPHTTDNYTTRVTLWDPQTNTHVSTNNDTDTDLFCAGSAHLWDGRILFAGGDGGRAGDNGPLVNSNIYNPVSNTWHRTENMNAPRWYSSVAALANGEMITFGGAYEPSPIAEVFQFDQTWRPLIGEYPLFIKGDYHWLQQTPEGTVLTFGPENLLMDIDTSGDGEFIPKINRDSIEVRDYGSYAMYDIGKILIAGGSDSVNTALVIDTATHQATDTSPLNIGRRQHNLTILADGSVLASGGNSDGKFYYSDTAGVYVPELWDPETGVWTALNIGPSDRQYHSIALLLPDGQVLHAGGGICGECYELGYEEDNGELFAPPYLFNEDGSLATRPRMGQAPDSADYGADIIVSVDSAASIEKAHLIKLGSTTHSENQDQRLVPLDISRSGRRLTLSMPESRNVAPPGHYLLFVVNNDGVPSAGSMLKLGQPLIGAGQQVVSTLEQGTEDIYKTNPATRRVRVELMAESAMTLVVSSTQGDQQNVECTSTVNTADSAVCEFDLQDDSALYLSVKGEQRGDYSLSYTDNAEPRDPPGTGSPETEQPDTEQSGTVQPTEVDANASGSGNDPDSAVSSGSSIVTVGRGSLHFWWLVLFTGLLIARYSNNRP